MSAMLKFLLHCRHTRLPKHLAVNTCTAAGVKGEQAMLDEDLKQNAHTWNRGLHDQYACILSAEKLPT